MAGQTGIMMLLKSMGFDPADFMKQIEDAKQGAGKVIQHFDARLKTIESNQALMLTNHATIIKLLEAQNSPPVAPAITKGTDDELAGGAD